MLKYISLFFAILTIATAAAQEPENPEPELTASGTLPTVNITTENNTPVDQKETYIPATLFIDGGDSFQDATLGNSDEPVAIGIRVRGNSSWELPKKPYKIKFDKKTSIFGLPKNKHYSLISQYYNWEGAGLVAGYEMGRQLGMPWAPHTFPVEVVLNGEYIGLYFLTENVKIASGRLDIYEQDDENTDEETIPYGWLLEIDNYKDEAQIVIQEKEGLRLRITHKTPEVLSDAQRKWLVDEMTRLNDLIYSTTYEHAPWMEAIDAASLARYMIVREVCNDYDGFNGSCYFHRDMPAEGSDEEPKWTFGPLWDISLSAREKEDYLINSLPEWACAHWLPEMMKSGEFNDVVRDIWNEFYPEKLEEVIDRTCSVIDSTVDAYEADWQKWPKEHRTAPSYQKTELSRLLRANAQWFDQNINFSNHIMSGIAETTVACSSRVNFSNGTLEIQLPGRTARICAYDINGRAIFAPETACSIFTKQLDYSGVAIIKIIDRQGATEVFKVVI